MDQSRRRQWTDIELGMAYRRAELHRLLTKQPGLSRAEIAEALGWPPVALDCNIRNMVQRGLLRYDGVKGHRLYFWNAEPPIDRRGRGPSAAANLAKSPFRAQAKQRAPVAKAPARPPPMDWMTVISHLLNDGK